MQPLERLEFDAAELADAFPPLWRHERKDLVAKFVDAAVPHPSGRVVYARWPEQALPDALGVPRPFVVKRGVFDYRPAASTDLAASPEADLPGLEWHANFADPHLFCAYGTALLAQDELQVLEHSTLASIREALLARQLPAVTVDAAGRATPVTVLGVERRAAFDTLPNVAAGRPRGLYGNLFAAAPANDILAATTPLQPPTRSNIVAMAAPSGGRGAYRRDEITAIATTAYTAFLATVVASRESGVRRSIVHTGFWGCGAFGGNRTLMTILQALAAELAGVDVVYHAFDTSGIATATDAAATYRRLRSSAQSVADVIDAVLSLGLNWGIVDGN